MRTAFGLTILSLLAYWPATASSLEVDVIDHLDHCVQALSESADTRDQPLPEPFRVGSWNIMKEQQPGATALHRRLIERTDVFLTQEAVERDEVAESTVFAPGYRRGDLQTGVATSSNSAADVVCTLSFKEPWLRTPKVVLATRFPFADEPLLIVNLHAINFTLGSKAYARQLAAIEQLVKIHDGPVIVGGDLNNWNSWRERVLVGFAEQAGLTRVAFSPDWRSRHLGRPVDSALVRGFQVLSAAALPTTLSDHHPILLVLTVGQAPGVDTPAANVQQMPER